MEAYSEGFNDLPKITQIVKEKGIFTQKSMSFKTKSSAF